MKRPSVGCMTEATKVPRYMINRATISIVIDENKTRSKMKTMIPIVVSPRNRWGFTASKSARPPVDMTDVYHLRSTSATRYSQSHATWGVRKSTHAHVMCRSRSFQLTEVIESDKLVGSFLDASEFSILEDAYLGEGTRLKTGNSFERSSER